jgi:hypothetical protein
VNRTVPPAGKYGFIEMLKPQPSCGKIYLSCDIFILISCLPLSLSQLHMRLEEMKSLGPSKASLFLDDGLLEIINHCINTMW